MTTLNANICDPMKLGLGAVQMGIDYGISNKNGKTTKEEVVKILEVAARNNIRIIDTAAQYGNSEEVLGNSLPKKNNFKVVTKTISIGHEDITLSDVMRLEETFFRSIEKLRVSSVFGLLAHHAEDLIAQGGDHFMTKMMELKQRGFVEKIGVSIYTGKQIDDILNKYSIDIIQLPINVLDQRLLNNGYLSKLKAAGVEIHARSVFLQGLLLMNPDGLPPYFDKVKMHLKQYHESIRDKGMTPVQAALRFVAGLTEVDAVICGVNNHRQLEELCAATHSANPIDFSYYAIYDEPILNPSQWHRSS